MDQRLILRAGGVFHGRTKDISEGGLGATVAGELETDDPVELEFHLPGKLSPMKIMAQVRYRRGFQYGFLFLDSTPEQRFAIREGTLQLALAP
jgi:PilZ domain